MIMSTFYLELDLMTRLTVHEVASNEVDIFFESFALSKSWVLIIFALVMQVVCDLWDPLQLGWAKLTDIFSQS